MCALEKGATKIDQDEFQYHQSDGWQMNGEKKLSKQIQSRNDDLIRFFYVLLTIFFKCIRNSDDKRRENERRQRALKRTR